MNNYSEIIGKSHEDIRKMGTWDVSKNDISLWKEVKQEVMYEEKPCVGKTFSPFVASNKQLIFQLGNIIPIYNRKNKVCGTFNIALDITNQINPYQIRRSYKMLYKNRKESHKKCLNHFFDGKLKNFTEITERELDCLMLASKGLSSKRIAEFMKLSYRTVESHVLSIKEKLAVDKKEGLIDIIKL